MLEPRGHALNWPAFADAWRGEYQGAMEEVGAGRIAFCKLDVLHRRNLDRILPRFGLGGLAEDGHRGVNWPGIGSMPGPTWQMVCAVSKAASGWRRFPTATSR